jgi:glycosyltransferase involved in cell wall biosynthesis
VVIPTYNRARLLAGAVGACLAQTHGNVEVIIVNDGSKDDTEVVGTGLVAEDGRVRYLRQDNSGIAAALNCGFREARGRYVTWISDDNRYHPNALATMVAHLDAHPETGFVYANVRAVDASGKPGEVMESGPPEAITQYCVVRGGCFLYRREVMEAVGPYDGRWKRCQDYDFYLRVSLHTRMDHIPEVLYDYGVGEESMSSNHEAHVVEHARLLTHHFPQRRRLIWARAFRELAGTSAVREAWARTLLRVVIARVLYGRRVGRLNTLARMSIHALAPSGLRSRWRRLRGREGEKGRPA